jgi:hypothetical protein
MAAAPATALPSVFVGASSMRAGVGVRNLHQRRILSFAFRKFKSKINVRRKKYARGKR